MELTNEMTEIFRLIEETKENLFVTGKAGTGKSTFLRYIIKNLKKNAIVCAPTGIAAVNIGGATLHSTFQIPFGPLLPNQPVRSTLRQDRITLLSKIDVLIVDEISMVRPDVLDYVDKVLKVCRVDARPFGGVQIVMFGDPFQLPPVVKKNDIEILQPYYQGYHFFFSMAIRAAGFRMFELNKVFRQSDQKFVAILNRIREYELLSIDINDLAELRNNRRCQDFGSKAVHLCSLKRDADKINASMIGTENVVTLEGSISGNFNPKSAPCDLNLKLREGARVMTLVNNPTAGYYNGTTGVITEILEDAIIVTLDNGNSVSVERYTWTEHEYTMKKGKVVAKEKGSFTQFPLALGWAITIHKSQGLTFDKVAIHCPYAFAPGMVYVALSRCTSMEGITTDFFIGKHTIKPDKELMAFNKACKSCENRYGHTVYKAVSRYLGYEDSEDHTQEN